MKIYIVGPIGSGKTTLSKILSQRYHIPCYELDCLIFDDQNGHVRRSDKEVDVLFNNILKEDSWIIEDVGRNKFAKAKLYADKIYYLKIPKDVVYRRVIRRWRYQRRGKETFYHPPTVRFLFTMLKMTRQYFKKEQDKLAALNDYKDKVIFLDVAQLNDLEDRYKK